MPDRVRVTRSVLAEQVKERLLADILSGAYPPNSRIIETELARELGTSQAPVREALRGLEALGVVELTPFRGARVRRLDRGELIDAYVVRSAIESLGARPIEIAGIEGDPVSCGQYFQPVVWVMRSRPEEISGSAWRALSGACGQPAPRQADHSWPVTRVRVRNPGQCPRYSGGWPTSRWPGRSGCAGHGLQHAFRGGAAPRGWDRGGRPSRPGQHRERPG